jgi:hypothetical protein
VTAHSRLSPRRYRWFDRASKLLGVALVGAGLDAGGGTTAGLVLAALGVVCGLATVVVSPGEEREGRTERNDPNGGADGHDTS